MIIDSIRKTIEREGLIQPGDKVLVALSGGPDSVCLLSCLKTLSEEYDLKLYAAHLNHKIRGIEAQKDASYAGKLCDSMGITFFVKAVDVPKYAKDKKLSLEEAAREMRYKMLFEIKEKINAEKIAVAHNLDDQAETVLMRIIRGSGITGLKGMDYYRKDGIIRPLMDISKTEILAYCDEKELNPRIDHTNLEPTYARNKIRLQLLPYLEREYAPGIKNTLSRMANVLREDASYLDQEAEAIFQKEAVLLENGMVKIHVDDLKAMHISLRKRIIRLSIRHVLSGLEGIENIHIEDVVSLINNPKNHLMINLPKHLMIYKRPEGIFFTLDKISQDASAFRYLLKQGESLNIEEIGMRIESKIMSKEKCMMLPTGQFTKAFDLEKIQGDLIVRTRQDGDKMKPMGLGGTKKVKDIFIDLKVPREERDNIPLLTDDQGILWMIGHKISDDYKIDESTKTVLRISCKEISLKS